MGSPSSPCSHHYYSAPSSPTPSLGYESDFQKDENMNLNFNEFEFETSKRLRYQQVELERNESFWYPLDDEPKEEQRRGRAPRGGSLPMMSFADDLFRNGLILPIKPPPILKSEGAYLNSITSSPRSPSSILKSHFSRRSKWDDEFDPFAVALKKVKEEKRSSTSKVPTRRTRSLSPFRGKVPRWSQDHHDELAKPKKSPSNRWFCGEFKENEPKKKLVNPKGNDSVFGRRLGGKIMQYEEDRRKSKRGFLFKYTSFGREKNEVKTKEQIAALWMKSSLGKLSFKLKANCVPSKSSSK